MNPPISFIVSISVLLLCSQHEYIVQVIPAGVLVKPALDSYSARDSCIARLREEENVPHKLFQWVSLSDFSLTVLTAVGSWWMWMSLRPPWQTNLTGLDSGREKITSLQGSLADQTLKYILEASLAVRLSPRVRVWLARLTSGMGVYSIYSPPPHSSIVKLSYLGWTGQWRTHIAPVKLHCSCLQRPIANSQTSSQRIVVWP